MNTFSLFGIFIWPFLDFIPGFMMNLVKITLTLIKRYIYQGEDGKATYALDCLEAGEYRNALERKPK